MVPTYAERRGVKVPMVQQPMTLNQMMQDYQQLTTDLQARQLDKASYSATLTRLMAMDSANRWWSCTPEGGFVWYDGVRWISGQPVVSLKIGKNNKKTAILGRLFCLLLVVLSWSLVGVFDRVANLTGSIAIVKSCFRCGVKFHVL